MLKNSNLCLLHNLRAS